MGGITCFFWADVITRYKGDPEKYTLEERSIYCRNAWHLPTFDVNEAGQARTYICYLAKLPYKEQLGGTAGSTTLVF